MASLSFLFLGGGAFFFFLLATTVSVYTHMYQTSGNANDSGAATTHLHFYMHDEYAGPRPTAMRVVSGRSLLPPASSSDGDTTAAETSPSSSSSSSRRQFGDIAVLNNALDGGAHDRQRTRGHRAGVRRARVRGRRRVARDRAPGPGCRRAPGAAPSRWAAASTWRRRCASRWSLATLGVAGSRAGTWSPGTTTTTLATAESPSSTSICSTNFLDLKAFDLSV